MEKFKKRLTKKILKRVAAGLSSDKPIPKFYTYRAMLIMQWFYDHQYLTVFRPWWYDRDWTKMDFVETVKQHYAETDKRFQAWSGIDSNQFVKLLNEEKAERGEKPERKPKPRKEKSDPPIRKLRKPQQFEIGWRSGIGEIVRKTVTGELAFRHGDHDFFIYHNGDNWCVTDVAVGAVVARDERYKRAVERAKQIIAEHYEKYVQMVEKHSREAKALAERENEAG
jgi:hypothetical protein